MNGQTILTLGITTYERPGALDRAVQSILRQPGIRQGDVELVVVDDASTTDAALDYLSSLVGLAQSSPIPVRLIRHSAGSGGPSTGRNEVIEAATGAYVLFLDDDNSLLPGVLAPLLEYLSSTSADWVSLRRRRNGRSFFKPPEGIHENLTRSSALWTFLIAGAFRRNSLLDLDLRFDPAISYGEDNEFVLAAVTRLSNFTALSNRDYVLEGDPLAGESPHISHLRPGIGFVRTLILHVQRLYAIIASAPLPLGEAEQLALLVLNRSFGSYKLHHKIANLSDDATVSQVLQDWTAAMATVLSHDRIVEFATKRGYGSVVAAILMNDVEGFREAVRTG